MAFSQCLEIYFSSPFAENSLSIHAFGTHFSPEVCPGAEERAVNKSKILVFICVGRWGGVQENNK